MQAKRLIVPALVLTLVAGTALAAKDPIYAARGAAIKGYDPVAYFLAGAPQKGDKSITHTWQGAVWRFASAENRERFAAEPEAYAPQYGGYCAYAVSQGYTASTDPSAWTILDGKLYLNYSRSVREKWLADTAGFIAAADRNWPSVLD